MPLTLKDFNSTGKKVDFLLIGWGWNWWQYESWWGWAWWVIQCCNYVIPQWNYEITVWPWWNWFYPRWSNPEYNTWCPWCDSCFDWLIAYWWGWWWPQSYNWQPWWSWWGWGWSYWIWWAWCSWQWYKWWDKWANCKCWWYCWAYRWWGWGWAWWPWCDWSTNCISSAFPDWNWHFWGMWWIWIQSDISWTMEWYAWGGSASWDCDWRCRTSANCWWTSSANNNQDATICWAWWGWVYSTNCSNKTWKWGNWLFIVRYKTACWYNITWWTCYTCWDYTIHCFTSSWTLCVN